MRLHAGEDDAPSEQRLETAAQWRQIVGEGALPQTPALQQGEPKTTDGQSDALWQGGGGGAASHAGQVT